MSSKKLPSFSQWKQLFKVLKGRERTVFLFLFGLFLVSAVYLISSFYLSNTKVAPAFGGTYTEGIVGQPRFINPIYGETNDLDRTLLDLVYSGIMAYDKDGKIIPDLVKNYSLSDNGKIYTFELKDDIYWQDGAKLTADDVIYTIKTIQNSDYKSPLRANWLDVDAQKLSDKVFTFSLASPYNSFLENCTVKIMPQHLWKNVPAENFSMSPYNLHPIGSGPYALTSLQETGNSFIKSIGLTANSNYYSKPPYISKIYFNFFSNKEDLIAAANQKQIDGFSISALDNNPVLAEKEIRQGWTQNDKFSIYSFSLPRYFAVFFNKQSSRILSDNNITQALNYSVNKDELLGKIKDSFKEKVVVVNSPILPDYFGFSEPANPYFINLETAGKLLDKSGFKDNGEGQRSKANNKKPAFQFKTYLKIGSSGNEVTELQACLARLDVNLQNLMSGEANGKFGKGTGDAVTAFQEKYLPETKSTGEVGTGTRTKLNQLCFAPQDNSIPLKFTLTTINQPELVMVAEFLRDSWQKIGTTVEIKTVELSELKDVIKNRNYDALLYGQALGSMPDLYPFWHSTQINDPGLNLSEYQNSKVDQLLKDARETSDETLKAQKYQSLQDLVLADAPALFLYNPDYLYWVLGKVKGIDTIKIVDPAKRFENITNWYVKTRRVWK